MRRLIALTFVSAAALLTGCGEKPSCQQACEVVKSCTEVQLVRYSCSDDTCLGPDADCAACIQDFKDQTCTQVAQHCAHLCPFVVTGR